MEEPDIETVRKTFDGVCGQLNMDNESRDQAWSVYTNLRDYYTLEGEQIEWLGCALYVAGQSSSIVTVDGQAVTSNNVSLTQILRETKLNLIEFFKKVKKWIEMTKLSQDLQCKIEALERKFEVSSIIFDKYRKVFQDLFVLANDEKPVAKQRNRKTRGNKPCSANEVFRFGWTLYIHVKGQYPQINDDLVNSHHLLLCCVDMIFCTCLITKRRDLLNPECSFLPEDFGLEYTPPLDMPCILSELCDKYKGIEKECRVIRNFYWKPPIEILIETGILRSSPPTVTHPDKPFLHLLTPGNFSNNDKSLNREYEMSMLAQGDFDERVFLHSNASQEIGTPVGGVNFQTSLATRTPPRLVQYGTPLLGRERLVSRDYKLTPASEATHSVAQLQFLLENCPPSPSEGLARMCGACSVDPLPGIKIRVDRLGDIFTRNSLEENEASGNSFGKARLQLSKSLYYKLLDSIMRDEERKNSSSLQGILEYELFHTSLFALAVEIVLCSYNSQSRVFPWVLEVFQVSAYHFYKLVEPAIRQERDFPRAIVKHLNRIEEMILSSLAWKSGSPLFDSIDTAASVPLYSEVALHSPSVGTSKSSLLNPRVKSLSGAKSNSPLSSLQERICSPGSAAKRQLFPAQPGTADKSSPSNTTPRSLIRIAPKPQGGVTVTPLNSANMVRKMLIKLISPQKEAPLLPQTESAASSTSPPKPPVVTLISPTPPKPVTVRPLPDPVTNVSPSTPLSTGSALRPAIPTSPPIPSVTVTPSPRESQQTTPITTSPQIGTPQTPVAGSRPKKTGSLALFYRKTYLLAYIRIKDLCERMNLDNEFVKKVWTCFEHCMVKSEDLMRDRHLDQLIMCSIYILAKVMRIEGVSFQEIMAQYRHQPQAKNHIYRSVLLNNGPRTKLNPTSCAAFEATPTSTGITPVDQLLYKDDIEIGTRGDIIKFYNKVFIGFLKDFVLKFSPSEELSRPTLSPLPVIRKTGASPVKKVHPHIFVSPHKSTGIQLSPLAKTYVIQKSPASDLKEINRVLKRPLDLHASPFQSPAKRPRPAPALPRKPHALLQAINSVVSDRQKASSEQSKN